MSVRAHRTGFLLCLALVPAAARADGEPPALHPGCVELGLAGALVAVEGTTRAEIGLRGGTFLGLGPGLAGLEMEVGYGHRSELDQLLLFWDASWQMAIGASGLVPYVAAGGGVQQEWIGSFSGALYPVGFHLGLRALAGERAGIRAEYRWHRVLGDPVSDFNEQIVLVGISLFLRNRE